MEKVDILLSVYKPDREYLIKQLNSLNNQDYENLEIIINDDCPECPCDKAIFEECLTKVPYRILEQDKNNLNYTKSFGKLVRASTGDYVAFCDQDDIWFSNKISKSVETLKRENALLVACDVQVIDGDDNVVIARYRDEHLSIYTGHDKWIISCASVEGRVAFIDEPLAQYRRHGKNVSGILIGIESKADYMQERVIPHCNLIEDFIKRYPDFKDKDELLAFSKARMEHNIKDLYKYRSLAPQTVKFEIAMIFVPDFLFNTLIRIVRKISKK